MTTFNLPDLGEGLTEAEIVAWHVGEGDHVIADQPLVSVETDKAVVEIPAPQSGTVGRLIAQAGDIVAIGGALAEIDTGQARDSGAIVGALAGAEQPKTEKPAAPEHVAAPHRAPVRASPAARKLARERHVDLAQLTGSGPGGTIQTSDVIAAASGFAGGEQLRGVRRAMARAMARSHASVVPATVMDTADIGGWPPGEDPTLRLIRAIALACAQAPALNAWFDGDRRLLQDHVDLAIAIDTQEGLFAPVLRAVESREDVAQQLSDLKAAVKDRSIAPEALKGGTITLSNFGMIGGEHAVLVVTPPQVAILGAGRISEKCIVSDGKPQTRPVLPLSLTFDHRAVTGGEAARFLAAVRAELERPSATQTGTQDD